MVNGRKGGVAGIKQFIVGRRVWEYTVDVIPEGRSQVIIGLYTMKQGDRVSFGLVRHKGSLGQVHSTRMQVIMLG